MDFRFIAPFPVSRFQVPGVFGDFWKFEVETAIFNNSGDLTKFENFYVQIIDFLKLMGYFIVKHKIGHFSKNLGPKCNF